MITLPWKCLDLYILAKPKRIHSYFPSLAAKWATEKPRKASGAILPKVILQQEPTVSELPAKLWVGKHITQYWDGG